MTKSFDCDVLICGGGPTGVTLGLSLAQRGVSVIIVEKEAGIYPLPRAAHLDHEIMRIFQGLGVAEQVVATCRHSSRYDFLNASGKVLLRFEVGDKLGDGGWPRANHIHQPAIEEILHQRLAELPNVELRHLCELTDLVETSDGVQATCVDKDGSKTITARYVVGADGARSPTRERLNIEFEDLDFDEPWLVIDAIVHDYDRLPKVNLQICDPKRPTTCVLMGEGRHRWEFMMLPGETAEEVLDDGFVAKLLEPWDVEGAVTLERKAVYRFNARVAKKWRDGRILLAGDAAHQTPPFAGQGMAAGLRDADNLAWKLASIIHGNADGDILDSYQPEREPHVRATIDMAILMGKTVCITNKWSAFVRDVTLKIGRMLGKLPDGNVEFPPISAGLISHGSRAAGTYFPQPVADGKRLDDLLGRSWWLISREGVAVQSGDAHLKTASLTDPVLSSHWPALSRWLDDNAAEAVLVRPDHYVFGTGEPNQLVDEFRRMFPNNSAATAS
ncbi:bifunctional 3-(3-hydroxy-phenyl)propionate/3-hydroxycinnamic acid hydroxylase [Sulfitobacter sp.]|uniref:bifunctional 3-(3-hydroxy-phenyl)propionate/3-hydroxycinnamic acid hydroxylase MhpA n=1 Tax=Sulfitobacter sp. TaxID=1903071 RepID=UPI003EF4FA06